MKEILGVYYFYGVSVPKVQSCTSYTWDLLIAASRLDDEVAPPEAIKKLVELSKGVKEEACS